MLFGYLYNEDGPPKQKKKKYWFQISLLLFKTPIQHTLFFIHDVKVCLLFVNITPYLLKRGPIRSYSISKTQKLLCWITSNNIKANIYAICYVADIVLSALHGLFLTHTHTTHTTNKSLEKRINTTLIFPNSDTERLDLISRRAELWTEITML